MFRKFICMKIFQKKSKQIDFSVRFGILVGLNFNIDTELVQNGKYEI